MSSVGIHPSVQAPAVETIEARRIDKWGRIKHWWKLYLDAVRREPTDEEKAEWQTFGF
ncbi:MAG TPA: hypothetical protein VF865_16550 [Acidobacteriaceae bacterium]